jgi:membrane dipeptidase
MRSHKDVFAQVRDFRDIPGILASGRVAAILTVENAAALEEGLDVVDEYAADGVKIAGITWNGQNALGSGYETERGLSKLGRAYVAALEKRGIVVDVSHLNDKGFWELERIATRPFIATHSNSRAVCDVPRNLTDKQFRAIAERGGLVGLNFHQGFVREDGEEYGFDQLIAHVEHWLELDGEDVISLGSDRDGSAIPAWLADCSKQEGLFEKVSDRLGATLARKLFAENALRFLQAYEQA